MVLVVMSMCKWLRLVVMMTWLVTEVGVGLVKGDKCPLGRVVVRSQPNDGAPIVWIASYESFQVLDFDQNWLHVMPTIVSVQPGKQSFCGAQGKGYVPANMMTDCSNGPGCVGSFLNPIWKPNRGTNNDPTLRASNQLNTTGMNALRMQMVEIHNNYGQYLTQMAANLNCNVSALAAVLKVESGGMGFLGERMIIRFENQYFYQNYATTDQKVAIFNDHFKFDPVNNWDGHMFRADVNSNWQPCHTSQIMEWTVFEFAQQLDNDAALYSVRMGAPLILGLNYREAGYVSTSVDKMYLDFTGSIKSQLDGFIFFVRNQAGCLAGLQSRDFGTFAACYNNDRLDLAVSYGQFIGSAAEAYDYVVSHSFPY